MKVTFKKLVDRIHCQILDVNHDEFKLEDGFYCYDNEFADNELKISFKLKIAEDAFLNKEKISSVKKHTYFRKRRNGFCILFRVPRGKYAENKVSNSRFYFYQENSEKMRYSFRILEIKENAFDYEILAPKKNIKNDVEEKVKKKKKLTVEEKRIKRQKWSLEHLYQGGAFSPK